MNDDKVLKLLIFEVREMLDQLNLWQGVEIIDFDVLERVEIYLDILEESLE